MEKGGVIRINMTKNNTHYTIVTEPVLELAVKCNVICTGSIPFNIRL